MPRAQVQPSINAALASLEASPLSRKKAMLLVLLIDAAIDDARPAGADILAHRDTIAATHPALALVMELAAMRDSPRLAIEPRDTADAALTEPDYMVSLYNSGTLPRLLIRTTTSVNEAL